VTEGASNEDLRVRRRRDRRLRGGSRHSLPQFAIEIMPEFSSDHAVRSAKRLSLA
jgi:hypothetical protein